MPFVDEVKIYINAGNGGKGCESFYRDKFTRYPKPNGGDGGKGGDVILIADHRVQTLLDYRFQQHFVGERGGHGSSKGKKGKDGADKILKVPEGTIIRDHETKLLIRDLDREGESVIVAKGGRGGRGNQKHHRFTSPGLGEQRTIHLELKLIADVGIIGFPNAGKSTLISQISKVKSKIANYPFTTRHPILGVVDTGETQYVVADLPGLIEGAHAGKGLGDRFLKHAERTKVLVQLIDMAGSEGRDPLEDFEKLNEELLKYKGTLTHKKKLVVANKMDLPTAKKNLKRFRGKFSENILEISALEKKGLEQLVEKISALVAS